MVVNWAPVIREGSARGSVDDHGKGCLGRYGAMIVEIARVVARKNDIQLNTPPEA